MTDDVSAERGFVFDQIAKALSEHGFVEATRLEGDGKWTLALAHRLGSVNVVQSDRELRMSPTLKQLAELARYKASVVVRSMERAA